MIPTRVPESMASIPGRRRVDPDFAYDERPKQTHAGRMEQMRARARAIPPEIKRARDRKSYLANREQILARKKAARGST